MSVRTCLHPNCDIQMRRGHTCCGPHWSAMTDDLRGRYAGARGEEARGAVRVEIVDYYRRMLVGRHEAVACGAETCDGEIIFLPTSKGTKMPVNRDGVSPDDTHFVRDRHTPHFATCTDPDHFRRRNRDKS